MSVAYEITCILFLPGMIGVIDNFLHAFHSCSILIKPLLGIYGKLFQLVLIMLDRLQVAKKALKPG